MSADKRTVTTDALDTLGTVPIDGNQKRDAIHLAVEPVVAGERLKPGDHIKIENGSAWKTKVGDGLGIVDPFLGRAVSKGERFWLILYPRTIQSLRHVWSHPAFPEAATDAEEQAKKEESEKWLRDFCLRSDCPDYDTVMALIDNEEFPSPNLKDYDNGGEYSENYLHFRGYAAHGSIPLEFWIHAEIVLGKKLAKHPAYFSCSC